jgi:hypothetical protein
MKRIIILPLLFLAAVAAASPARDEKEQLTGVEIINRHIAAVGGKEAIARLKTRVASGTVKKFDEPEAKVSIASEAPNRVSATYNFAKVDWRLAYDGARVVFRPMLPADQTLVQAKYFEMISSGLMFNGISLYNLLLGGESEDLKFQAKGSKKVKGRQAHVVEIRRKKQPVIRLFFDAEDFMWVRTEFGRAEMQRLIGNAYSDDVRSHSEDESVIDFMVQTSDFREVDGVKLPFKFEQTVSFPIIKGRLTAVMTGTITEYRHNLQIDPKVFQ